MEGLNDELSMQLMVATFANYQELVDRALMIEGKQQQIENCKRKYGQESITLELSRSLVLPQTRDDIPIITMDATLTMEEVHITTVALRMEMGMEETTIKTVPTQQHPLRRT